MSSRPNTPYRPRLCSHDVSKWIWGDKHLTLDTKAAYPDTCFVCVTVSHRHLDLTLSADVRTLDAFHQKCLRQLLGIRRYDRVRNDEVLQRTDLTSLSNLLSRQCISVFRHVARLDDVTPANMALQLHINVSLNRPPDRMWCRPSGRPCNKWLDQLWNDSIRLTADLWRRAVNCGHGGATTRQPSPAKQWWWWWWWLHTCAYIFPNHFKSLENYTCVKVTNLLHIKTMFLTANTDAKSLWEDLQNTSKSQRWLLQWYLHICQLHMVCWHGYALAG